MSPMLIKQVLEAVKGADDNWTFDGVPLHHIKLIATIDSMEQHTTNFNYFVSDGSASIECKKWTDTESGGEDLQNFT